MTREDIHKAQRVVEDLFDAKDITQWQWEMLSEKLNELDQIYKINSINKDWRDEDISAFAFNLGKEIEKIINHRTDNLESTNRHLESKILSWFAKTKDPKFADFFDINSMGYGK